MNTLRELFIAVLNMSITASYVALGVMLVRLFLKKVPKVLSYVLWIPVLFRLVSPIAFTSAFSFLQLINLNARPGRGMTDYVPRDIGFMGEPAVNFGINSINNGVNTLLPQATPMASVNPMQIWMAALSVIWLAGFLLLLIYSILSYVKIKRRLKTATLVRDSIFETDQIGTAFVCGFLSPKIYVPVGVPETHLPYILAHEQTHIRRCDYLIKPLAFLVLTIHWFNPLMWVSFALMSRDMEMSCDESVLRKMGSHIKGDYSNSLLSLSIKREGLLPASPLAFGESSVKARIKNVLNYKKSSFWILAVAVLVCCVVVAGFVSNPQVPFDLEKTEAEAMLFSSGETALLKIGEAAFDHYYSSFMGEDIPKEYRITGYKLNNISQFVEDNLKIIMSSPQTSSNPQDYIDAHQREYNAILALDARALPYLFSEFEQGGQTGLKGHIMARLCRKILFEENISYEATSPQDWYDTYKAHVKRLAELNSPEWVKGNHPKAGVLLAVTGESAEVR